MPTALEPDSPLVIAGSSLVKPGYPALAFWWSMIFSENRYPPRIKSGAGLFGIMLYAVQISW